jgi:ribose transport system substrate-binding protein
LAGCASNSGGDGGGAGVAPEDIDLSEINPDGPIGAGPTGAEPQSPSTLDMSDEQIQSARAEEITVSVVFQYLQSDWVRLVRRGLQTQFVNLEVDVEGVYGVDFDAAQQVDLLETLASKSDQLDAVIVYPVDPDASVEPIRQLRADGVEVIIITNTPPDLVHGEDFAGMVTVDNYGLGLVAGRLLREMVGEGKVGMIEQEPQLYVIDERERAVREVLSEAEGIEMVSNSFNEASETFDLTQNLLTANPDTAGLWSPWASPPANEAVSAISDSGRDDFIHVTVDLNQQQAAIMAEQGVTKGIGVGGPFVIGENLVKMTAHAILGNETPPYVGIGARAVIRPNLLEMYEDVLREDPPESVTEHFE